MSANRESPPSVVLRRGASCCSAVHHNACIPSHPPGGRAARLPPPPPPPPPRPTGACARTADQTARQTRAQPAVTPTRSHRRASNNEPRWHQAGNREDNAHPSMHASVPRRLAQTFRVALATSPSAPSWLDRSVAPWARTPAPRISTIRCPGPATHTPARALVLFRARCPACFVCVACCPAPPGQLRSTAARALHG
jgi:hypothetical protein